MLGRVALTRWLLLAWAVAVYGHVLAWLFRPVPKEREGGGYAVALVETGLATAAAIAGTLVFTFAAVHELRGGSEMPLVHVVALAVFAYVARNAFASGCSVVMLTLVLGRVALIDPDDTRVSGMVVGIGTEAIPGYMIIGIVAALVGQAMAWAFQPRRRGGALESALGTLASMGGTLAIIVVCARTLHGGSPLTAGVLAWLFVLLLLVRVVREAGIEYQAWILLALLAAKWFLADGMGTVMEKWNLSEGVLASPENPGPPLFNLFTANAVLLCVALTFSSVEAGSEAAIRRIRAWGLFGVLFALANFETLRAVDYLMAEKVVPLIGTPWIVKNVALSVLWACVGFGAIIVGFWRKVAGARWLGLILLALTVGKIMLVDMANVQTILRVLTFMVVGVLLLGVSYVYHKQAEKMKG